MAAFCNNGSSFFFFSCFFLPLLNANLILSATRRSLHQPFFPADPTTTITSAPPPQPPTTITPFFPLNPSIPTPTTTVNPPPAAIPSVIIPTNVVRPIASKNATSDAKKIAFSIVTSLIVLAFLLFTILLIQRRISGQLGRKCSRSTSIRLFPATYPGSTRKVVVTNGSEPLYLGTLRPEGEDALGDHSPYRKLDSPSSYHQRSPDLQPLPPLSHQCQTPRPVLEPTDEEEDEESFYSPRGSSIGNRPTGEICFRLGPQSYSPTRHYSGGSNLTTPSYPSSKSTSPMASKPPSPGPETASTVSEVSTGAGFRLPPPSSPEKKRISPTLSPSTSVESRERSPSLERSFSALTPAERNGISQSSSPDGSTGTSASSEKDFSSSRLIFSSAPPPPPPPPPPPKGSLWHFAIPSRPPPIPPRPTVRPPLLVPPPGNVKPTKSDIVTEVQMENNRTTTEDIAASKSISIKINELSAEKPPDLSGETTRPKLKPLHWDKVRASSDRVTVWDQLKSSSFQLNEEMIETLFVCNAMNTTPKDATRRPVLPSPIHENRVLDPKKSQNIAILLRALSVTKEEVCEALIEGNTDELGSELLETLLKMAPTKEEELKLKGHADDDVKGKLGTAERFLKAIVDIPFAFKRVDAMLYITNFDSEITYLRKSFQTLEAACEELRSSRLFLKLLEAVLKTGNRMNVGTNRGDAHAFKLDTLLKLVDVKGTDGKTTLLHFVVQEIIRSEGAHLPSNHNEPPPDDASANNYPPKVGLQVLASLCSELGNVKKAASMDSDVLGSYVSKLDSGIAKIAEVLRLIGDGEANTRFASSMASFERKAMDEILKIRAEERVALSLVKEITEYFHGNAAREEAHPFRIFVIVRDFLNVLDRVCKQIGQMKNQAVVLSTGRHFPVPVNPTLVATTTSGPTFQRRWTEDRDDSGNSS